MASNDLLAVLEPESMKPATSNYAQFDLRNNILVISFDAAIAETAIFNGFMPYNYSGNGITVTIIWAPLTASSGNLVWATCFERNRDSVDLVTADSFTSENTVTVSAPATFVYRYTTITFTNAQIDGLLAGESYRFRLRRDAAAGADSMTGDAQVYKIILKET